MKVVSFLLITQRCIIIYGYPVHGGWTVWAEPRSASKCSITCGRKLGTITIQLTRSCTSPRPINGGKDCAGDSKKTLTTKCIPMKKCPINGEWGGWSEKQAFQCSVTCGSGTNKLSYERFCNNPSPNYGGLTCPGDKRKEGFKKCETDVICDSKITKPPVNGGWGAWVNDTLPHCSVTCGTGIITVFKRRRCNNPTPAYGGSNCVGNLVLSKHTRCSAEIVCKIDGGWGDWLKSKEGKCSVTCGSGIINIPRNRKCNDPKPSNGGKMCAGKSSAPIILNCDTGLHCLGGLDQKVSQQVVKLNNGLYVGIIVPVVVLGVLAVCGIYFFRKKKTTGEQSTLYSEPAQSTLLSVTRPSLSTARTKSTLSSAGAKSTLSSAGAKSTLSSAGTKSTLSSAGAKSTMSSLPTKHAMVSHKSKISTSPTKHSMASPNSKMSTSPTKHTMVSHKSKISTSPTKHAMASPNSKISTSPTKHAMASHNSKISTPPTKHAMASPNSKISTSPTKHAMASPNSKISTPPTKQSMASPKSKMSTLPSSPSKPADANSTVKAFEDVAFSAITKKNPKKTTDAKRKNSNTD